MDKARCPLWRDDFTHCPESGLDGIENAQSRPILKLLTKLLADKASVMAIWLLPRN